MTGALHGGGADDGGGGMGSIRIGPRHHAYNYHQASAGHWVGTRSTDGGRDEDVLQLYQERAADGTVYWVAGEAPIGTAEEALAAVAHPKFRTADIAAVSAGWHTWESNWSARGRPAEWHVLGQFETVLL